jgi:hypothetical protein
MEVLHSHPIIARSCHLPSDVIEFVALSKCRSLRQKRILCLSDQTSRSLHANVMDTSSNVQSSVLLAVLPLLWSPTSLVQCSLSLQP